MERSDNPSPESGIKKLLHEIELHSGDMTQYTHDIIEQTSQTVESGLILELSRSVNNVLNKNPGDSFLSDALSFQSGGQIAIHAAHALLQERFHPNLLLVLGVQVGVASRVLFNDDSDEAMPQYIDTIFEIGTNGYQESGELRQFFQKFVGHITHEGESSDFARLGFGFVAAALDKVLAQQEQVEIDEEFERIIRSNGII